MPTLTINATTEQLQRVQTALGLSSSAEVKQWVIDTIRSAVKNAEVSQVASTEEAKVEAALQAKNSAVDAKLAEADVELT